MSETRHTKVLIIGSGPAGYTAGVYASRTILTPTLVQGREPCGQVTTTPAAENCPLPTAIQSAQLMYRTEGPTYDMGAQNIE